MVKEGRLIKEEDSTEQPTNEDLQDQPIQDEDHNILSSMLEELKDQRDKLNKQIKEIEQKLK